VIQVLALDKPPDYSSPDYSKGNKVPIPIRLQVGLPIT